MTRGADTVAKLPKWHAINFPQIDKRAANRRRMSLQAVTEVACEFIADYVVPQMIIRSPRVRPGKFVLVDAKRLLQQYLPGTDIAWC
jgi:hypothetical protein